MHGTEPVAARNSAPTILANAVIVPCDLPAQSLERAQEGIGSCILATWKVGEELALETEGGVDKIDLHGGDPGDARFARQAEELRHPGKRVMVREGGHGDAVGRQSCHQLARPEHAIREPRVEMLVGRAGLPRGR